MTVAGISGDELIALGHAAIAKSHELILLGGVLGLLSIVAGLISRRVGAPMLLVFLALGMLAGEDGVLGIPYDDFTSAYLIGSVALAVILFEGGLKTPVSMLRLAVSLAPVLVLTGGLAVFGLAQLLGTSGFLATYVAAVVTGATRHRTRQEVEHFFEGMAWLAQIVLFLMLGLLVTPHDLLPYLPGAIIGAAVLIFLGRPVAVFACLLPFRFTLRETAFASWVGLRGAVPIYLSIIPALVDPNRDKRLFASIFILVIASLVVQGWTVGLAARLLAFARRPAS